MRTELKILEDILKAKGYSAPTAVFTATKEKDEWSIRAYAGEITVENAIGYDAPTYDDLFILLVRDAPAV